MKRIRYWLTSKRQLIAQLQEARDECDTLGDGLVTAWDKQESLTKQLLRLSRERYQERELRLAAEELRDEYLEQLENEEE